MSLLTQSDKDILTGVLFQHYLTFRKQITVHKQALQTFTAINNDILAGYGDSSQVNNITYTPVSGVFLARVRYDNPIAQHKEDPIREISVRIPKGGAVIMCEEDCKSYILNGKTEKIESDNRSFNVVSDQGLHDYLGLKFYYFTLENTV